MIHFLLQSFLCVKAEKEITVGLVVAEENEEDLEAEFQRLLTLHDELKGKIDQLFEEGKITPEELQGLLDNPENFNSSQWFTIEKHRDRWDKMLRKQIGPEAAKDLPKRKKKKKKGTGKGGKKFIGKRKGWLSMD